MNKLIGGGMRKLKVNVIVNVSVGEEVCDGFGSDGACTVRMLIQLG